MNQNSSASFPDFKALLHLTEHRTDSRWKLSLQMAAKGDIEGGAQLVAIALADLPKPNHAQSGGTEKAADETIVGYFSNAFFMRQKALPKAAVEMLCAAADAGHTNAAYNAASALKAMPGSRATAQRAQKYFLMALEHPQDAGSTAATLVNYGSLIEEGNIDGRKDYAGALALFEQAAEIGLVTAMYRVGKASMSLMDDCNDPSQVQRGIFWLSRLIERYDASLPFTDMDDPRQRVEMLEHSKFLLAKFHIYSQQPGTDFEFGLKLIRTLKPAPGDQATPWLIAHALMRRVMNTTRPEVNTPGNNWHYVLGTLGWRVGEISRFDHLLSEMFVVDTDSGQIPFFVVNALFQPDQKPEMLEKLAGYLFNSQGVDTFLLAPSFGIWQAHKGKSFTPIMVGREGVLKVGILGIAATPEQVVESASTTMDIRRQDLGADSCIISIAVNTLNEGGIINQDANLQSRAVNYGKWSIPVRFKETVDNFKML